MPPTLIFGMKIGARRRVFELGFGNAALDDAELAAIFHGQLQTLGQAVDQMLAASLSSDHFCRTRWIDADRAIQPGNRHALGGLRFDQIELHLFQEHIRPQHVVANRVAAVEIVLRVVQRRLRPSDRFFRNVAAAFALSASKYALATSNPTVCWVRTYCSPAMS